MVQTVALIITLVSGVAGGAGGGYFAMKYYNKSLVDPDELEKQIINKIYQIRIKIGQNFFSIVKTLRH